MSQITDNVPREETPSIKARILRKAVQYSEGILINWLSAISLLGFLWVVQQFWGLRLIPFNLLDALLLAGVAVLMSLVIIVLLLYYALFLYLSKHPTMALGLFLGMLVAGAVASRANNYIWAALKKSQEGAKASTVAEKSGD